MCDKKNNVLFTDTECIILSSDFKVPDDNHVLLRVPRENNMYNVDLKNIIPLRDLTCLVACKKGKQHRASCKSKHVSSVSQPLQMLHMDLFGPTFVKSLNKKSYCLVVTDDYSRFSWVFFLATKDETSIILKPFITGIENQINLKVKIIRSEDGTEFKNQDLNQLCGMKRIKREFSIARTPQQNGIAEKRTRPIEAARTMLADSLLPIPFWGSRPTWLFDIDTITQSMNYQPGVTGNQPTFSVGIQEHLDTGKAEEVNVQQYMIFALWFTGFKDPQNTDADTTFEVKEPESKVHVSPSTLKFPVVDYQIHTDHNKPYYKIIRVDGTHQLFLSFISLLRNFDREDLEMLWKIVQERFAYSKPNNFLDDFLLNTLKTMFEKPNVEAHIWKNQRGSYGLAKVKSWKLLESCGVHIITFITTQMILLVERIYPLIRFTLEQMLNNVRLEVEEESEVSLELLRFVRRQQQEGYKPDFGVDVVEDFKEYMLRDYYYWLKTYCCCECRYMGATKCCTLVCAGHLADQGAVTLADQDTVTSTDQGAVTLAYQGTCERNGFDLSYDLNIQFPGVHEAIVLDDKL
uniref:Integrase catalytic domain-containing protein n=1 Tax=Tanacetum cinerariifolium TaxID=118510 RepID=A0A6L2NXI9_TANCI|nr:hypothetical protein [Tanacetum cinerariifolium]